MLSDEGDRERNNELLLAWKSYFRSKYAIEEGIVWAQKAAGLALGTASAAFAFFVFFAALLFDTLELKAEFFKWWQLFVGKAGKF